MKTLTQFYIAGVLPQNRYIRYSKEIRQHIKDGKKLKEELSRHSISKNRYQYLTCKIKKADKLTDSKIADYNNQGTRQKIGRHGTISKQHVWKVKNKLAEVLSTLTSATGDEMTDPMNIGREYHRAFQHRLRKQEIESGLEEYESLQ